MNNGELLEHLSVRFTFARRPVALVPDLRASWRIAILLLILARASWANKSSLKRLHLLSWAIRSNENWSVLGRAMSGKLGPAEILVRFEPALNRAIDFAIGLGLIERVGGDRIRITPQGNGVVEVIRKEEAFLEEREKLDELGKSLTEGLATVLLGEIAK